MVLFPVHIVHYIKWLRLRDGGVVRAVIDIAALLATRDKQSTHVTIVTTDDADAHAVPQLLTHLPNQLPNLTLLKLNLVDPIAKIKGRSVRDATGDTPTQILDATSRASFRTLLQGGPKLTGSIQGGPVLPRADVLHLHGIWTTSNWQAAAIARSLCVPYVVSSHGMLDRWCMTQGSAKKMVHLALASGKGLRAARAIHCTARAEAEQAHAAVKGITTRVVELPFDATPFAPHATREAAILTARAAFPELYAKAAGAPIILFMSRLHAKKGVLPLIQAWKELASCSTLKPLPMLALAGPFDPPSYESVIRDAVKTSPLRDRIALLGSIQGDAKLALLQAADLFILPTSQENFGYAILESLASGTPVVTTKGVDIWQELEQSGGCVIVEPAPANIAATVAKLLTDVGDHEGGLRLMGLRGKAWANAYSNPEKLAMRYQQMYTGIGHNGDM